MQAKARASVTAIDNLRPEQPKRAPRHSCSGPFPFPSAHVTGSYYFGPRAGAPHEFEGPR